MNIYIWERVSQATNNYHPEGGVIVVAETLNRAIELAADKGAKIEDNPDYTYNLAGVYVESVVILPDAGCC